MARETTQEGYRIARWGEDPVWQPFAVPRPGAGEALVKVEACGIGLTVLNWLRGDLADERATLPRAPGHELVGRIVEVGDGEDQEQVGRRVTTAGYLFCGVCPECRAGRENRCSQLAGYVGIHRDGGYAPYAALPLRNLVQIPEGLDALSATVVPDAVATSVHVCRGRAKVGPGDRVAIIGAGGGVGIHLLQVARIFGADVAGLDVTDEKLGAIEELQATAVGSADLGALSPMIWRGGRPTVVVDLVGTPATLGWAVDAVEVGGRVVVLTTFRDVAWTLNPRQLVGSEAAIIGSRGSTPDDVRLAAELVADGKVRPIIGLSVEPTGVPEVHRRLREGTLVGRGALVWS